MYDDPIFDIHKYGVMTFISHTRGFLNPTALYVAYVANVLDSA